MNRFSGLGLASLLTAILLICMTVFSTLCLSSARADKRLSDSYCDSISDYYAAENEANRRLAQLRREGNIGEHELSVAISEGRELSISVVITAEGYEIIRWQAISTDVWEADDSLPVWKGE